MHWPGVSTQVSRAHLDMIVMCYNPSSNLATHAVNPLSICFTEINVEAAVDVQVLCAANHEVFSRSGAGTVRCFSCIYRLGCSAGIVMLLIMCVSWVLEELKLFSVGLGFFLSHFA